MSDPKLGDRVHLLGAVEKVRDLSTWRPRQSHCIYTEALEGWPQIKAADGRADGHGHLLRTRLVEAEPPADRGVIVGKRSIQQGVTDYDTDGYPTFFPCETTTVYLVAYHLSRRPAMCLPEQITIDHKETS